jgi:hypothetical protein
VIFDFPLTGSMERHEGRAALPGTAQGRHIGIMKRDGDVAHDMRWFTGKHATSSIHERLTPTMARCAT